jgi:hypothetical protein
MYREAGWAPEEVAPYQVKLEDGSLIFAPHDEDEVIRRPLFDHVELS